MPDEHSHRDPLSLDLAMRVVQVDRSWYERYWLGERRPRPAGTVPRILVATLSTLCLARDHMASVLLRRAVSAMVQRKKVDLKYGSTSTRPMSALPPS